MSPDRLWWARRATALGWLVLAGWFGVAGFLLNRIRYLSRLEAPFADGVWDQRLEVMSFAVLPQQGILLALSGLSAAAAAALTHEAGATRGPWLSGLLTTVFASSMLALGVGIVSIVNILARSAGDIDRWGDVYLRVGGLAVVGAATLASLEAIRQPPAPAPGSSSPDT